jgi:hypothetical protein
MLAANLKRYWEVQTKGFQSSLIWSLDMQFAITETLLNEEE